MTQRRKSGRPEKEIWEYLDRARDESDLSPTLSDYENYPILAFQEFCIRSSHAIRNIHVYGKEKERKLRKERRMHYQFLAASLFGFMMSHFETMQRFLFAKVFEQSSYISDKEVQGRIEKWVREKVAVDYHVILAWRDERARIGIIVADSLPSYVWHDPEQTNKIFFNFIRRNIFSNDDLDKLKMMWQIRHSIAHTAGILTLSDAGKSPKLRYLASSTIMFKKNFISNVSKKLFNISAETARNINNGFNGLKSKVDEGIRIDFEREIKASFIYADKFTLAKIKKKKDEWKKIKKK